jgi:hypothetical protein
MRPPTDPILGIVPADPALRRLALPVWATLAAIGGGATWYGARALREAQAMVVYDPRGAFLAVQRVIVPVVIAGVVLSVIAGVYCLVNALRIIRAGRFPAPGARMISATPIRRGAAAHRVGVAMAALAMLMLAASVAMPVFLQRVLRAVEQTDHRFQATPPASPATPADVRKSGD